MRSIDHRFRRALASGVAAIAIAVPTVMTLGDSQPVVCDTASEAFANGATITAAHDERPGIRVCVSVPRWYRTDSATTLDVTVTRVSPWQSGLVTFIPVSSQPEVGPTALIVFERDTLFDTVTRSARVVPNADQSDVATEIRLANRPNGVIYEATVAGRAMTALDALNARLEMAVVPTLAGIGLLFLAAWLSSRSRKRNGV